MTRTTADVESLADFDEFTARRKNLAGVAVQGVDLRDRTAILGELNVTGGLFLGCEFADGVSAELQERGAIVFPDIPDLPFDPYRANPYAADDLYDHPHYASSFDARVYAWSRHQHRVHTVAGSIAMALHDHSMTEALAEAIAVTKPRHRVGIMGGHGVARGSAGYAEAAAVGLALARAGRSVLTGGGPGAMEAANLGASFSERSDAELTEALQVLATAPSFADDIDAWAAAAHRVRATWPVNDAGARSIGIPTWFYGHEPPNQFATVIAKFFANPLREATLLERCQGGIIYLAGAAGTVSEIFMDACENYYAPQENIAPMVLVGVEQWTETLPAYPLLQKLASSREMSSQIHLVDTTAEAIAIITESTEA